MKKTVDFLIIGQGLCGTLLSWYLLQAGKSVLVLDESQPSTATKVASGVINPVTGRRIVRTWRVEELLPFAWEAYLKLGQHLGVELVRPCNILDFHPNEQMRAAFEQRMPTETDYLKKADDEDYLEQFFNYRYGVGEIQSCLLVDLQTLLPLWRTYLLNNNLLAEHIFNWAECNITDGGVEYDDICAEMVICCDGVAGFSNPYFSNLPYSRMKGEALIVSIPGLPRNNIYKQGLNIVPWKNDLFWIGSTYEWNFKDVLPTPAWRKKVEEQLRYWLKLPFKIIDHLAAERPANLERRPFVGVHPTAPRLAILNGMGAKGCSIAPFFARQLADHLVNGSPIYADADVKRFEKALARKIM